MTSERIAFNPDWVVAPGETLADWFAETGPPRSIAQLYGIDATRLEKLIEGVEPIDEDLAQRLFGMTGVTPRFWLALEHNFRVGLAAGKTWSAAPTMCTGVTASWCPIHGDCTCPRDDDGEPISAERVGGFDLSAPGCPLHDPESGHGR